MQNQSEINVRAENAQMFLSRQNDAEIPGKDVAEMMGAATEESVVFV